jgi:Uma2 family endonuclease
MVNGDPFKEEEEPMTAALPRLDSPNWTVDDVAHLPEDLHYELINGRLILTPAAMPIHQSIGVRIVQALEANGPEDVIVTPDSSVTTDIRNEPRPDVVVTREEGANRTPILASDVLLVVEITSKSSRISDRDDKMKLYADAGIVHHWIIDPLADRVTFTQYVLGSDGVYHLEMKSDDLVTIEQPWKTTLDLPAWTRRRDRLREVARPDR